MRFEGVSRRYHRHPLLTVLRPAPLLTLTASMPSCAGRVENNGRRINNDKELQDVLSTIAAQREWTVSRLSVHWSNALLYLDPISAERQQRLKRPGL